MPHIYVLAIIPLVNSNDEIEAKLCSLLYPHGCYYEFEPYRIPCECVWTGEEGIEAANRNVGDFHKLWHTYKALPEIDRPEWSWFIRKWEETALEEARSDPNYRTPNPDCDICDGEGLVIATYPPSGLRYEAWAPNQWEAIGFISEIVLDPIEYDTIVTPDGQSHGRYSQPRSGSREEWIEVTNKFLQEYKYHLAIKCFVNK